MNFTELNIMNSQISQSENDVSTITSHNNKSNKICNILHKNRTSSGAYHEIIVERSTGNAHPHTP